MESENLQMILSVILYFGAEISADSPYRLEFIQFFHQYFVLFPLILDYLLEDVDVSLSLLELQTVLPDLISHIVERDLAHLLAEHFLELLVLL